MKNSKLITETYSLPFLLFIVLLPLGCNSIHQPELKEGVWRGVFTANDFDIPFNFNVERNKKSVNVYLINGSEKVQVDSIRVERDSVIIPVDVYDTYLIAKVKGDSLNGFLRRGSATKGTPFYAVHNQSFRFNELSSQPDIEVSGKWSVNLINQKAETRHTIGLFSQRGSEVTGTILTTTGDFRYLQGIVDGDSIKLSSFGGSSPSLLRARRVENNRLEGEYLSPTGKTIFEAVRNDTVELPDPYTLTYLKDGYDKFSFSFPDLTGKQVSLADEKYKDKVVVVTIMGSWCPNCLDEAAFLAPWYQQNRHRGVEIIALSFERKDDLDFARERLGKFIQRFNVQYDVLFAGPADKVVAGEKLPSLSAVLSFPTTIIIDRKGKVRKIHTGFYGPATGAYYDEFIKQFNEQIDLLTNEIDAV